MGNQSRCKLEKVGFDKKTGGQCGSGSFNERASENTQIFQVFYELWDEVVQLGVF